MFLHGNIFCNFYALSFYLCMFECELGKYMMVSYANAAQPCVSCMIYLDANGSRNPTELVARLRYMFDSTLAAAASGETVRSQSSHDL